MFATHARSVTEGRGERPRLAEARAEVTLRPTRNAATPRVRR